MKNHSLQAKLDKLPDPVKMEALDFIEFLRQKYQIKKRRRKLKFDWEGGLADLKNQYTAVELQHKAGEWR